MANYLSSTPKTPGKPRVLALVGPTASGKTSLSIALAKRFNGEVISADSRQVYKGMDIGTGKVTKKEMRGVPHYLLDVASPRARFTVTKYQTLARRAIARILSRAKLPIIVGGTGLYVDAVLYRHHFPAVKPNPTLRKKLEAQPTAALFAQLQKLDPRRAATIDRHNPRRLVRALEIILTTKQPVPSFEEALNSDSDYEPLILGLRIPESKLRANIRKRLLARLRHGMLKEVERLHQAGVSWKRLEDFGLEYRSLSRYLQGLTTKQEMITKLEYEIWLYAKRQMTWFRKNKSIVWVKNPKEAEKAVQKFLTTETYRSTDVIRPSKI